MDAQQLVLKRCLGHGVERPERLVHQHDCGLKRQRAGDLDALLHAAGQLPGIIIGTSLEADHFQRRNHTRIERCTLDVAFKPERDIAGNGPPLQKRMRIVLEHDDDAVRRAVNRFAAKHDSSIGRGSKPAQQPEQRGLAGARRADDGQRGTHRAERRT